MNWIDVKERWPEPGKIVLFCTSEPDVYIGYIGHAYKNWESIHERHNSWCECGNNNKNFTNGEVTHWMLLPELPEINKL